MAWTAAAATPATFEELAARAAAALAADKAGEAIELYRQALQLKPNWEEGWWFVGIISYDSQRFADGEKAFAKLVEVNSKSAPGWDFLGLCEYETGAYDAALQHIERGLSLSGGPPEVEQVLRFHQALLLTRQSRWDAARRIYRGLVQRGNQNPILIAGIGVNALERPMLPSEVPADQQELVLMAGDAAFTWMAGDKEKIAPKFRAVIDRYPKAAGLHYLYATYLLSSNQQDEGNAELKRELELNPGNPSANGAMALVLVLAEKATEALEYARKAAVSGKPDARMLYAYGLTLVKTGDIPHAIEQLEAAEKLDAENMDVHIVLAGAYSQAGRMEEARRERSISIAMARGNAHP